MPDLRAVVSMGRIPQRGCRGAKAEGGEGRRSCRPSNGGQGAFVADQMSVLPNVAGQSASGHGAGSANIPAASDAARYACTGLQTVAFCASVQTPSPWVADAAA